MCLLISPIFPTFNYYVMCALGRRHTHTGEWNAECKFETKRSVSGKASVNAGKAKAWRDFLSLSEACAFVYELFRTFFKRMMREDKVTE